MPLCIERLPRREPVYPPPGGSVHRLFAYELAYHFPRGREHRNKLHKPNSLRIHSQETRTSRKPAKPGHFPSKCASISSSVLPFVSGRKNAATMK